MKRETTVGPHNGQHSRGCLGNRTNHWLVGSFRLVSPSIRDETDSARDIIRSRALEFPGRFPVASNRQSDSEHLPLIPPDDPPRDSIHRDPDSCIPRIIVTLCV